MLLTTMVFGDKELMACRGHHGNESDKLLEVDLQVSILVEVREELIQDFIVVDFLSDRKSEA